MKKGLLVCFTGHDGSGKTTQAKNLEKHIKNSGKSCNYIWCGWRKFDFLLFRPIVKLIKKLNLNKQKKDSDSTINININDMNNIVFGYCILLDYILKILPQIWICLYRYDFIIADRFIYDIMVGFSISYPKINLIKWYNIFPKPDIIFYIDVPENLAFNRKNDIPSIDYLHRQKIIYTMLSEKYNMNVIDGRNKIDDISNKIIEAVKI